MTQEENIFFAKRNLVDSIWKSANLEGINITFPETQMIISGFSVGGKTIEEITIITNLKRAWEYLFATINDEVNLDYLQDIHRLVGRDVVLNFGFLRTTNVKISGTNYAPVLPVDYEVRAKIDEILSSDNKLDVALDMMLYIARSQLFFDGNKRTAMLTANKILIQNGLGILSVSKDNMIEFFTKLVKFYETNDSQEIKVFCKEKCIETLKFQDNGHENKNKQSSCVSKNTNKFLIQSTKFTQMGRGSASL
ncbi:Fic domain-containing protein [Campylobacter mucosalis]|uniref:Fic family protein n=1 Tax=Campylobacter mucosalis TaxID=202 RepID=UPI0009E59BA4|nr:Fic family protein [Campylobacter mucosalis]QKF62737.1 Fic domain-containing protein [Campylobacter mucosalis]